MRRSRRIPARELKKCAGGKVTKPRKNKRQGGEIAANAPKRKEKNGAFRKISERSFMRLIRSYVYAVVNSCLRFCLSPSRVMRRLITFYQRRPCVLIRRSYLCDTSEYVFRKDLNRITSFSSLPTLSCAVRCRVCAFLCEEKAESLREARRRQGTLCTVRG